MWFAACDPIVLLGQDRPCNSWLAVEAESASVSVSVQGDVVVRKDERECGVGVSPAIKDHGDAKLAKTDAEFPHPDMEKQR